MIKLRILAVVFGALFLVGAGAIAQRPERDISGGRHPNLAAALRLCAEAWDRISEAQRANEWDMRGHAQRAKDLLDKVNHELKMAAEEANRR